MVRTKRLAQCHTAGLTAAAMLIWLVSFAGRDIDAQPIALHGLLVSVHAYESGEPDRPRPFVSLSGSRWEHLLDLHVLPMDGDLMPDSTAELSRPGRRETGCGPVQGGLDPDLDIERCVVAAR